MAKQWQSRKILLYSLAVRRATRIRGLIVLVPVGFDLLVVFDVLRFFMGLFQNIT